MMTFDKPEFNQDSTFDFNRDEFTYEHDTDESLRLRISRIEGKEFFGYTRIPLDVARADYIHGVDGVDAIVRVPGHKYTFTLTIGELFDEIKVIEEIKNRWWSYGEE